MDMNEFHHPTHDEIEARIRAARQLRAEMIGGWLQSTARWLTHPRFGHRHA